MSCDLAGFHMHVQRNGRKVYVVQSRGCAGLKRVTLGPSPARRSTSGGARRPASSTASSAASPGPAGDPTVGDLAARCMRQGPLQAEDPGGLPHRHRQAHRSLARNHEGEGRPLEALLSVGSFHSAERARIIGKVSGRRRFSTSEACGCAPITAVRAFWR